MLPVAFKVPGTNLVLNYSSSEVLLSKKYGQSTAFIIYGQKDQEGETCLNAVPGDISVIYGAVKVSPHQNGSS